MTRGMTMDRLTKTVFFILALVGVIGFVLSYEALMTVAHDNGKPGWLGVIWPLIIDVPIVGFSLAAVIAKRLRRSAAAPRFVVVVATAATVAYNWYHAHALGVVAVTVAVAAPVAYFAAFEIALWLIGILTDDSDNAVIVTAAGVTAATLSSVTLSAGQPTGRGVVRRKRKAVSNAVTKKAASPSPPKHGKSGSLPDLSHLSASERRDKLPELSHLSAAELAAMFGKSSRTIYRDANLAGIDLSVNGKS